MSPTTKLIWLYSLGSLLSTWTYFYLHWQDSRELYWSVVALLNKRLCIVLLVNLFASAYFTIVVTIHDYVFGVARDSERLVGLVSFQGYSQQG